MKTTENFKKVIKNHLQDVASKDELFAETLKKKHKTINDCITYILNQVKASGCVGFADDEIFSMAVHYYDEDDVKIGDKISNTNIIVNHTIKLTEKEIKKAKQDAVDMLVEEEKERLKSKKKHTKTKEQLVDIPTLF